MMYDVFIDLWVCDKIMDIEHDMTWSYIDIIVLCRWPIYFNDLPSLLPWWFPLQAITHYQRAYRLLVSFGKSTQP